MHSLSSQNTVISGAPLELDEDELDEDELDDDPLDDDDELDDDPLVDEDEEEEEDVEPPPSPDPPDPPPPALLLLLPANNDSASVTQPATDTKRPNAPKEIHTASFMMTSSSPAKPTARYAHSSAFSTC